jgi:predicted acyl esterase
MQHPSAEDPFWKPLDCTDPLDLDIAILFTDGWYDYPTRTMIADFEQRQAAGLPCRMRVGGGTHFDADPALYDELLSWFDHHLTGRAPMTSSPSLAGLAEPCWR